jgi:hypothetical protein
MNRLIAVLIVQSWNGFDLNDLNDWTIRQINCGTVNYFRIFLGIVVAPHFQYGDMAVDFPGALPKSLMCLAFSLLNP